MNWKNEICIPFHLINDSCVRACLLLSTFSCTCFKGFDALIFYHKRSNAQLYLILSTGTQAHFIKSRQLARKQEQAEEDRVK